MKFVFTLRTRKLWKTCFLLTKMTREIQKIDFRWARQETEHKLIILGLILVPCSFVLYSLQKKIYISPYEQPTWSFSTRSPRLWSSEVINTCHITYYFFWASHYKLLTNSFVKNRHHQRRRLSFIKVLPELKVIVK